MAHHDKIIEGRIDELIELIDNSQIPRFGSADRSIVNADEIAGILVDKFQLLIQLRLLMLAVFFEIPTDLSRRKASKHSSV